MTSRPACLAGAADQGEASPRGHTGSKGQVTGGRGRGRRGLDLLIPWHTVWQPVQWQAIIGRHSCIQCWLNTRAGCTVSLCWSTGLAGRVQLPNLGGSEPPWLAGRPLAPMLHPLHRIPCAMVTSRPAWLVQLAREKETQAAKVKSLEGEVGAAAGGFLLPCVHSVALMHGGWRRGMLRSSAPLTTAAAWMAACSSPS